MELAELIIGVIGGGTVGTVATAIIGKIRTKGQKLNDNDTHLRQLSEIMSETIKNVQDINKETISGLKAELVQQQELTKLSHQREDQLILLIQKGREYQEVLERNGKHKTKIIQKAKKCDLLKGKPLEDCIVLNAYDEYAECKAECKLKKDGEDSESKGL